MKATKIPQEILLQQILLSLVGSFRMEGIIIEIDEAQAILKQIMAKRGISRK